MNKYFSGDIVKEPFAVFSSTHIITLVILAVINISLMLWFKKSQSKVSIRRFGHFLGIFILLNEFFYIGWSAVSGAWSIEYSLPLHLCDAATFLAGVMLLTDSYFSFEILYFWGLGGSLQTLFTPDVAYPFPHCIYFSFFLGHSTIITAIIYMAIVKGYKPRLISVFKTLLFTNLYMAVIAVVNRLTGGNYMYLCAKPESASIIDFLGPWPWYILSLEAVGLFIFFLCYLPYGIRKYVNSRSLP